MNEEQSRAEFEAWWANFQSEHEEWRFADREAILFQAWQAALSAKSVPDKELADEAERQGLTVEQLIASNKRKLQSFDVLLEFYIKYALGSKVKTSCLKCGSADNEIAIRHLELPDIYICNKCAAPQPTDDRVRELEPQWKPINEANFTDDLIWLFDGVERRAKRRP